MPQGHGQDRQKPSSARPTQLNANIDEAIAVNVTMVLMDRMNDPPIAGNAQILSKGFCSIKARIHLD
jgi:hypothetical protein